MSRLQLVESVGVEDYGSWVFCMEGKPLGGLVIRCAVERPLLFSVTAFEGLGELEVSFYPSDGCDAVGLCCYVLPEISVGTPWVKPLSQLLDSVVHVSTVCEDV